MADIGSADNQVGRGSIHSSNMMIEISDLDVKDPFTRANTVTGKFEGKPNPVEDNYKLNF